MKALQAGVGHTTSPSSGRRARRDRAHQIPVLSGPRSALDYGRHDSLVYPSRKFRSMLLRLRTNTRWLSPFDISLLPAHPCPSPPRQQQVPACPPRRPSKCPDPRMDSAPTRSWARARLPSPHSPWLAANRAPTPLRPPLLATRTRASPTFARASARWWGRPATRSSPRW